MMDLPTPCIFAHRGASGSAPENTVAAFELAYKLGAHAVELDAKLTNDGEIIVIHDQTVDRTTNGSGYVHQKSLADFRSLDAGSWYSEDFVREKIPLLVEVLEAVGKKLIVNIEITNYRTWWDSLPEKIAALVKTMDLTDSVIFSSFYPLNLWKIKNAIPSARVALLTEPHQYFITSRSIAHLVSPQIQHPHLSDITQQRIEQAHTKGIRLHAWTVNDVQDMRKLFQWGIDGIFTDHPALALTQLDDINNEK
jgi:glycerophosphoryl diester phosphodiesterase